MFCRKRLTKSSPEDFHDSLQHCYISEKNSCASVFVRSSAPDMRRKWASAPGESSAEQGHAAPFHACLPRLPYIQILHPWAFSSPAQWATGETPDQPVKGGPVRHEPLQCSFLVFRSLRAGIIPFLSLFRAPTLTAVITAFLCRTSVATNHNFHWIQPPPALSCSPLWTWEAAKSWACVLQIVVTIWWKPGTFCL